MAISVYVCRAMTNRVKEDVVKEAKEDKEFLEKAGLNVLCPVEKEQVPATKEILRSSKKAMLAYWPQDKAMIREAHVVFDLSPTFNSEGVKHEIGYSRYCLWKPLVRVFPSGQLPLASSVSRFEDDFICDSLLEAIEYTYRVHGTLYKRLKWRVKMLIRCLPKWIWYQICEFK
jgi:hypothetical protein